MLSPEKNPIPNPNIAMKVLCSQVTQANKDEQVDIFASNEKLRSHGHVCDTAKIAKEEYENLRVNSPGTYNIPWPYYINTVQSALQLKLYLMPAQKPRKEKAK